MSVNAITNSTTKATAMINNGCCTYCLVNKQFVQKANLPRIPIPPIQVKGINNQTSTVSEITKFTLNVRGVQQHKVAAYITQSTYNYNIILGKTWLEDVRGVINTKNKSL
jgi:predicted aspartyl protease